MANRCLLHKSKLSQFIQWMIDNGIPYRYGKGAYQVLLVKIKDGNFAGIYEKNKMPEHYSIESRLEYIVRDFIKDRKDKK